MTYAGSHILLTFHGKLPGAEEWSVGLRTAVGTVAPADMQTYADFAKDCFTNFWTVSGQVASQNPPQVTFDGVIARQVDTAGHTLYQAESLTSPVVVGAGSNQTAPNQTATVISLITPLSGRRYRGRIYIPCLIPGVLPTGGRWGSSPVSNLSIAGAYLIRALSNPSGAIPAPSPIPAVVFPIVVQSQIGAGAATPVTAVKVGDVIDTQRRRRDQLAENYTTTVV